MIYIKITNVYNNTYRQFEDVSHLIKFIKENLYEPFEGKTIEDCLKILSGFSLVEEITKEEFEDLGNFKEEENWLKKLRIKYQITQQELSQLTGVTISTIQNIEQGKRKGSKETIRKINDYFI